MTATVTKRANIFKIVLFVDALNEHDCSPLSAISVCPTHPQFSPSVQGWMTTDCYFQK